MQFFKIALITLSLALTTAISACGNEAGGGGSKLKLVVIPKGTQHVFWKSVEAGARQAAKDLDVEIEWKGPLSENDRASQIQMV